MLGEVIAEFGVNAAFVGHDMGFFGDVRLNDRNDILFLSALDLERADLAPSHKRQDSMLVAVSNLDFRAFFPADVGFVDFND